MAIEYRTRSIGDRLRELAVTDAKRGAVTQVDASGAAVSASAGELAEEIPGLAASLSAALSPDEVICLPADSTLGTVKLILAALCAGVTILPHPPSLAEAELNRSLDLAGLSPTGAGTGLGTTLDGLTDVVRGIRIARWRQRRFSEPPRYLLATSGSTSVRKLAPFWNLDTYDERTTPDVVFRSCSWRGGQNLLVPLPLAHIAPFSALVQGILDANHVVLAWGLGGRTLAETIARFQIEWMLTVPQQMQELLEPATATPSLVGSLRVLLHTALPCPPDLKRAWIDLIGPERVFEMYGGTEGAGVSVVRGTEWLSRPGTVGRGIMTKIRIVGESGGRLRPGEVGRVYLRRLGAATMPDIHRATWLDSTEDGFVSLGDVGWVDEEGYLYIADRAANEVHADGNTVWLGRTSAILREHPSVADAECVLDTAGGIRALLVAQPHGDIDLAWLRRQCSALAADRSRSITYSTVDAIPRNDLGKPDRTAIEELVLQAAAVPIGPERRDVS